MIPYYNAPPPPKRPCIDNYDLPGEIQYLSLLRYLIEEGGYYDSKQKMITTFSPPMISFSVADGKLPLLTTRPIEIKDCIRLTVDIIDVIKDIIESDFKRIVETTSTWGDEAYIDSCSVTQYFIENGYISSHIYLYNVDAVIGLPYDMVHHALILNIIARLTGLAPKRMSISIGMCYFNTEYITLVSEQLDRAPMKEPIVTFTNTDKDEIGKDDVLIEDYHPYEKGNFLLEADDCSYQT